MIAILAYVTFTMAITVEAEDAKATSNEEVKAAIRARVAAIPDIENEYMINEHLGRALVRFLGGKMSIFPLYKVSLKIDREPMRIPLSPLIVTESPQIESKGADVDMRSNFNLAFNPLSVQMQFAKATQLGSQNSVFNPQSQSEKVTQLSLQNPVFNPQSQSQSEKVTQLGLQNLVFNPQSERVTQIGSQNHFNPMFNPQIPQGQEVISQLQNQLNPVFNPQTQYRPTNQRIHLIREVK